MIHINAIWGFDALTLGHKGTETSAKIALLYFRRAFGKYETKIRSYRMFRQQLRTK